MRKRYGELAMRCSMFTVHCLLSALNRIVDVEECDPPTLSEASATMMNKVDAAGYLKKKIKNKKAKN